MATASELHYCKDLFYYSRRETREVTVGEVKMGGGILSWCNP